MVAPTLMTLDQVPGEQFLVECLQKNMVFLVNNRVVKKGKLLLFRRAHYFIQFAIQTEKGVRENFDVPIPFNVEDYSDEGLMYFDYRLDSLEVEALPKIPEKVTSIYFNKILEIQVC